MKIDLVFYISPTDLDSRNCKDGLQLTIFHACRAMLKLRSWPLAEISGLSYLISAMRQLAEPG